MISDKTNLRLHKQEYEKEIAELKKEVIHYLWERASLDKEVMTLKDKLHRRNVQIKDLKVLLHKQSKWVEEANKDYRHLWSFITSNSKVMDIWSETVKNR